MTGLDPTPASSERHLGAAAPAVEVRSYRESLGGRPGRARLAKLMDGMRVAVKVLRPMADGGISPVAEACYAALASTRHPHLVQVLGQCRPAGGKAFVTELCVSDLSAFLLFQTRREFREEALWGAPLELRPLPGGVAVELALQALWGLQGLHSLGFAHGDVRAANLLVRSTTPLVIVLSGFGAAGAFGREHGEAPPGAASRSIRQAPECLRGESRAAPAGDMFMFGMLLLEILLGGHLPFPWLRTAEDALQQYGRLGVEGLASASGRGAPPGWAVDPAGPGLAALQRAALRCLQERPEARPSPPELRAELQAAARAPWSGAARREEN